MASLTESLRYPDKYFNTNVIGTLNVVQAARKEKIRKFIRLNSINETKNILTRQDKKNYF